MSHVALVLLFAALACAFPPATATPPPQETIPTEPSLLATVAPSPTTAVPTATLQVIRHVNVPDEPPAELTSFASDQDSFITSPEKRAPGGDRFTFGRYERPFNGVTMDVYFPHVDLQETSSYRDSTWIYLSLTVKGRDANLELSGRYGFEIDANIDGRGDWMILASQPSTHEWTTDAVEVWYDSNKDVGGTLSMTADEQSPGDGYDAKIFDRGEGDDPDLAWVRIPDGQPFTIQFAVKRSLLGNINAFMTGAWAGGDMLDPSLFDLNDHFTQDQAGSSLVEFEFYYPIKAIAEIDNTCRMAIGFKPTGNEPGSCVTASGGDSCVPPEQIVCVDTVYGPNCYCGQP